MGVDIHSMTLQKENDEQTYSVSWHKKNQTAR